MFPKSGKFGLPENRVVGEAAVWSGTNDALRVSWSRHHGVMLSHSQHGSDLN